MGPRVTLLVFACQVFLWEASLFSVLACHFPFCSELRTCGWPGPAWGSKWGHWQPQEVSGRPEPGNVCKARVLGAAGNDATMPCGSIDEDQNRMECYRAISRRQFLQH